MPVVAFSYATHKNYAWNCFACLHEWVAMHHKIFFLKVCMLASLCEDCPDCRLQLDAIQSGLTGKIWHTGAVQFKSSHDMSAWMRTSSAPFFPLHLLFLAYVSIYTKFHHTYVGAFACKYACEQCACCFHPTHFYFHLCQSMISPVQNAVSKMCYLKFAVKVKSEPSWLHMPTCYLSTYTIKVDLIISARWHSASQFIHSTEFSRDQQRQVFKYCNPAFYSVSKFSARCLLL